MLQASPQRAAASVGRWRTRRLQSAAGVLQQPARAANCAAPSCHVTMSLPVMPMDNPSSRNASSSARLPVKQCTTPCTLRRCALVQVQGGAGGARPASLTRQTSTALHAGSANCRPRQTPAGQSMAWHGMAHHDTALHLYSCANRSPASRQCMNSGRPSSSASSICAAAAAGQAAQLVQTIVLKLASRLLPATSGGV